MPKPLPLALLIAAGLLSFTVTASAYITYGSTVVNGTTYDLSPGANLTYANLSGAYLYSPYLLSADLSYANLSYTYLYGAKFGDVDTPEGRYGYYKHTNLNNVNLSYADLTNADLTYANLTNADLSGAFLFDANLSYANLVGANLSGADLSFANLTGATVSYSDWTDFNMNSGAYLGSYNYNTIDINYAGPVPTPIPEPSTYGLIGMSALGLAFVERRRKLRIAQVK